jgi:serine/threonine-protein kinase
MGEVYLAEHPRLPRRDALKVLSVDVSSNDEYRARFAREADLASTLWHPHIVGVHDRGEDDNQLWISMDHVDGRDASRLLADTTQGAMSVQLVSNIVTAVAGALDYAHDRNLLHRDVKPANIMITDDEQRILLADFGIARSLTDLSSLTATGFTIGTVAYAAPEQLTGEEIDGRADQYALAATAYHLLSGSHLYPYSNPAVVIGRHLSAAHQPLATTRPEFASLDTVLAIALAKSPDNRFRRCSDFAEAFSSACTEPTASSMYAGQRLASATDSTQPAPTSGPVNPTAQAKSAATRSQWPEPTRAATAEDLAAFEALRRPAEKTHDPAGKKIHGPAKKIPRLNRRRKQQFISIALVLLFLAIVLFEVRPWQERTQSATSTPPGIGGPMTFDSMRNFVEGYYADLPTNATDAWNKVDAQWQNHTGQRDFFDFWATMQSVTLVSVSPRDDTSVIARVRYVPRDARPSTEDRWLKMTLINGAMLLDGSGRIGTVDEPTTVPPTTGAPSTVVDNVLLTAAELTTLLGTNVTDNPAGSVTGALTMNSSSYGTSDHSGQVKPQSCVAVAFAGEHDVYGDKDIQAIKTQTFSSTSDARGPDTLQQIAAVFNSADAAQEFLSSTQTRWNSCANTEVDVTLGFENGRGFKLGSVQHHDDLITISMADNGGLLGAHACQQALGAHGNVVVEVRACDVPTSVTNPTIPADPRWAADDAARLANATLAKVK